MTQKTIILFGKNGQIGSNLGPILADRGHTVITLSSREVDFSEPEAVAIFLKKLTKAPDLIINAAAYTAVDKAECERDIANRVNNISVSFIAKYAEKNDIPLIHYSTDYVFDGSGFLPFKEDNTKHLHPLNVYGETKLAGEKAIIDSGCKYLILRTSWVYNHTGGNFLKTMLRLFKEYEQMNIVADQYGTPNYAYDLAVNTANIIDKISETDFRSSIYHLVGDDHITWFEFATKIKELAKLFEPELKIKVLTPIKTSEYKTPAARPHNSRLSNESVKAAFELAFPPVEDAITRCLKTIYNIASS